jgi:hypothetical protein
MCIAHEASRHLSVENGDQFPGHFFLARAAATMESHRSPTMPYAMFNVTLAEALLAEALRLAKALQFLANKHTTTLRRRPPACHTITRQPQKETK